MKTSVLALLMVLAVAGCQSFSASTPLYEQLGGAKGVAAIVDNLIEEISFDPVIFRHFAESDQNRFRAKWNEYLCEISGGPCQYTGDSMRDAHRKLNITEHEFNRTVDLLINAMNKARVPLTAQNRLLALLKDVRENIIYH